MKDYKEFNILAKETIMNELKGSIAEDLFDLSTLHVGFGDDGAYGINEYCEFIVNVDMKNEIAIEIVKKLHYYEDDYTINVDIYKTNVIFSISIYEDANDVNNYIVEDSMKWFTNVLKEQIEKF
ncbi:MAG: hypothetical protein MJZ34_10585 [Paludibacteraceae bacterium]|nr:hypothetical protein [Paludibacteraceae bacterium]